MAKTSKLREKIEEMDVAHQKIVRDQVEALIKFLDASVPRSALYSHVNMSLNILTGCLVTIAHNFIHVDYEEKFIDNMILTLRANFEANRNNNRYPKI